MHTGHRSRLHTYFGRPIGGFVAMRHAQIAGRGHGETAVARFLRGNGDAAGVACWRWHRHQYGANSAKGGAFRCLHIGIEFRLVW
jgi:hypothetical protein